MVHPESLGNVLRKFIEILGDSDLPFPNSQGAWALLLSVRDQSGDRFPRLSDDNLLASRYSLNKFGKVCFRLMDVG